MCILTVRRSVLLDLKPVEACCSPSSAPAETMNAAIRHTELELRAHGQGENAQFVSQLPAALSQVLLA